MILDKWQKDFKATKGCKILCCGRQVGKSEICSQDAAEWAIKKPKSKKEINVVMIAPTERQAFGLFSKTLNYLSQYHQGYIKMGKDRPTQTRIKLTNGVNIYCLPVGSNGLGIRFLTIHRLYCDEASRIPEEVWPAVYPALLTTGGDIIMLSTPFGAVGEFYKVWINKDGAYDNFTRFSVTSEEVVSKRPISKHWNENIREKALTYLDQAKKRMSKREYAQEYVGEFVEDLHRWFNDDLINSCCVLKRPERILKDQDYYMGCDIARMGEDEGTFEIVNKINDDNIEQVENLVTKKKLTTETEDKIIELDTRWDFNKVFIDAGSGAMGVGIYDHLLRHPELKRKIVAINNSVRPLDRDGKNKTRLMKTDLYQNMLALMEQGRLKLLDDSDVRESLSSIQYEYVLKEGEPTKLRIFGNYSHIVEGLVRACWCIQYKSLNIWVRSIRV